MAPAPALDLTTSLRGDVDVLEAMTRLWRTPVQKPTVREMHEMIRDVGLVLQG